MLSGRGFRDVSVTRPEGSDRVVCVCVCVCVRQCSLDNEADLAHWEGGGGLRQATKKSRSVESQRISQALCHG